ncbi:DUF4833 domain-containing protein [Bacteroidota bacterium]
MQHIIPSLLFVLLLSAGFTNPDQEENFPGDYMLFKIDRSRDADMVLYDVNLDKQGKLDPSAPISIYWEKITEGGRHESITGIQNKFGYGIRYYNISDKSADFQIIAYKDQTFQLRESDNNQYRVYTHSSGKEIELSSLKIHFEDDSFWFPRISKIEINGIETDKGVYVTETVAISTKE